jgi:hypothetical protein
MRSSGILWLMGALLCLAFLLVCLERMRESRSLQIPATAAWASGLLIACLGRWLAQPELSFATTFSAEHWSFLELWNPAGQLQFPRYERLFFLGSTLLGFLAAVDLGRRDDCRRRLLWTLSASGILVALYSVGQRWLGLSAPAWLLTSRGLDEFSSTYFNYSASAASLNLAWPWLVFGAWKAGAKTRGVIALVTLMTVVAALMAWPALSGWGVAGILLIAGVLWRTLGPRFRADARWLMTALAGLFLAAFLWQGNELRKLQAHYSDGWMGVEMTRLTVETRDDALRKASLQRSDRLVPSSAPPLPSVWMAALRMATDHPLIGKGPGAWVKESALYTNSPLVNTFFHMRQFAHHDLLQTAAEWGILPSFVWLVLWAGAFYRAAVRNSDGNSELALVLMLSGLALHSLVHFPLQVPALQLWTALLLGLAWSRRPRKTVREDDGTNPDVRERARRDQALAG